MTSDESFPAWNAVTSRESMSPKHWLLPRAPAFLLLLLLPEPLAALLGRWQCGVRADSRDSKWPTQGLVCDESESARVATMCDARPGRQEASLREANDALQEVGVCASQPVHVCTSVKRPPVPHLVLQPDWRALNLLHTNDRRMQSCRQKRQPCLRKCWRWSPSATACNSKFPL